MDLEIRPCVGGGAGLLPWTWSVPNPPQSLRNYLKSPFPLRGKVRMGVDPAG